LPFSAIYPRLRRHAPSLLGLVLILVMSVSLAWQTADWLRLLRSPTAVSTHNTAQNPGTALSPELGQLFGRNQSNSNAPAPATNLRLSLVGSFVHTDPKRSSAIIRSEGSDTRRYLIDDEISSGVRLHAVAADHVQLLRNGRRESLSFPQRTLQNDIADQRHTSESLEELRTLEDDNMTQLRERMEALREQMQASGTLPTDAETSDQPTEND
jgi:general secretion pathway protein C